MPKGLRAYGEMSVDEACKEFIKLVVFEDIQQPILVTPTRLERTAILEKLFAYWQRFEPTFGLVQYSVAKRETRFHNTILRFADSINNEYDLRGMNSDCIWQHDREAWFDKQQTHDLCMFALRLGDYPILILSKAIDKT